MRACVFLSWTPRAGHHSHERRISAARILSRDYAQFREFCRVNRLEIGTHALRISKVEHLHLLPAGTKVYTLSGTCLPPTFRQIVHGQRLHLIHLSIAQTDGTVRFTAEGLTPLLDSSPRILTTTNLMSTKAPKTLDEVHQGRTNIYRIPAKYVKPGKLSNGGRLNVRDDFGSPEEQDEMARSIAEHGIKQPLLGTWTEGFFFYDDGDRRMNGHRLAVEKYGLKGDLALIPIRRQPKVYSDEERTMDLLTLNSGKNLNMFEQAVAMHRLVETFGKTPDEVAKLKGCSVTHVKTCIELLTNSSETLREAVSARHISATTAADLVREVPSKERQDELLREADRVASAAGADKITAKHFSVPLGKKAVEARREPAPAPAPAQAPTPLATAITPEPSVALPPEPLKYFTWDLLADAMQKLVVSKFPECPSEDYIKFEYAFNSDDTRCIDRRAVLAEADSLTDYPDAGGRKDTDPFAGKDSNPTSAQTNDHGEFISGIINRPVTFSVQSVSGSVGLALRNHEWFMGIVLKWPGQSKEDGFLRIAPSLRSKAYEHNPLAEIDGVLLMRAELESKEFKGKAGALGDLDRHLDKLVRGLNPDLAKVYQAGKLKPLNPEPEPAKAGGAVPNPVLKPDPGQTEGDLLGELKKLLGEIPAADAEKDRLKTAKYIHGWLAGKLPRTELAKYLLGVVDKVEAKA